LAFRYAAHLFFVASLIAFNPAADIFRFLAFAGLAAGTCCFFCAAHLAFCAAAILARPALLIVPRFAGDAGSAVVAAAAVAAVAFGRPRPGWPSRSLMSAIFAETRPISL
jgi:hypothetical protein